MTCAHVDIAAASSAATSCLPLEVAASLFMENPSTGLIACHLLAANEALERQKALQTLTDLHNMHTLIDEMQQGPLYAKRGQTTKRGQSS